MTRVSLKEAYDNKDVVAQIYAIRDIAEGAEDSADSALSTANTASEHVDALVPQVEGAVTNANNASASAQASAQTVAGYENRLSNVELKITTAEGQIVTIQGRVTALETADGQNVKITGEHAIGNYAVLLTGNQTKAGNLTLVDQIISSRANNKPNLTMVNLDIPSVSSTDSKWSYPIIFRAADQSELGHLTFGRTAAGKSYLTLTLTDSNNTTKTITLGVND